MKSHPEPTLDRRIDRISLGPWQITCTHPSPYPFDATELFICQWCLLYFLDERVLFVHQEHACACRSSRGGSSRRAVGMEMGMEAVGRRVYTHDSFVIYQVRPGDHPTGPNSNNMTDDTDRCRRVKMYSQCLCLLAKLFMHEKTLFYHLDNFEFYVVYDMSPMDPGSDPGWNGVFCGFFSRELESVEGWNLNCVVVLPPYRRSGLGKLLIDLSYWKSMLERKVGTPERPLSKMGKASYRGYWMRRVMEKLMPPHGTPTSPTSHQPQQMIRLDDLERLTHIRKEDILDALKAHGLFKYMSGAATKNEDAADRVLLITKKDLQECWLANEQKWNKWARVNPLKLQFPPSRIFFQKEEDGDRCEHEHM